MNYIAIFVFILILFGAYMLGRIHEQCKQLNIQLDIFKKIMEKY